MRVIVGATAERQNARTDLSSKSRGDCLMAQCAVVRESALKITSEDQAVVARLSSPKTCGKDTGRAHVLVCEVGYGVLILRRTD